MITGPLWRLIEKESNILSLKGHFFRLKIELSSLCKDARSMINGKTIFDDSNVEHHRDEVFIKLFNQTTPEFDILKLTSVDSLIRTKPNLSTEGM